MPRNGYSLVLAGVLSTGALALDGCTSLERGRTVAVQSPRSGPQPVHASVSKPATQPSSPPTAADPSAAQSLPDAGDGKSAPTASGKPEYSPDAPPMPPVTMSQWVESQQGKVILD